MLSPIEVRVEGEKQGTGNSEQGIGTKGLRESGIEKTVLRVGMMTVTESEER